MSKIKLDFNNDFRISRGASRKHSIHSIKLAPGYKKKFRNYDVQQWQEDAMRGNAKQ